jgi:hypothetical protein
MASPTKINFKIYQGSTFRETLRWESALKIYSPITNISKSAPMVVTAAGHGVPVGWRVKISGAIGMKEANTGDTYLTTSEVTTNSVTFNSVNALNYTTYTGGGVLEYNQPVDLTGFSARMQVRAKLDDAVVIKELTTVNGGIVINNTSKTVQLYMSAADTAAFSFQSAVYSLELVSSGNEVTQLVNGSLTLVREVTR